MERSLAELERLIGTCQPFETVVSPLSISETDEIWQRITARKHEWCTLRDQHPEQIKPDS